MIAALEERGAGKATVTYRLRDWLISRQRFWGAPIPIIYCPEHGAVPVPEDQLPVMLPDKVDFKPTGESPLKYVPDFYETICPICGGPAKRETDTMDTFICSSWYFLRYTDPHNDQAAWDQEKVNTWMPMNMYIGGPEHAVMHLLYARFFVKGLRDMGHLTFGEPFQRLFHQGMVLGPDGQKMSKSRGNVIAPDDVVARYGADAVRCYLMFMGPFDMGGPWNNQGIDGVSRYLGRLWALLTATEDLASGSDKTVTRPSTALVTLRHKIVKRMTDHYEHLRFNTALAAAMEMTNALTTARDSGEAAADPVAFTEAVESLIRMLAPLAPYITEELWSRRGHTESVHSTDWPTFDEALTIDAVITMPVQVNGKLRGTISVAADADETTARTAVEADAKIMNSMVEKTIRKIIFIPGKLINFVVG